MKIQLLRADVTSLKVDAMVTTTQPAGSEGSANMLTRFVVQVEPTSPDEADADAKLRAATTRALQRAEELAIATVGLPPMWNGSPEITERCARNMLQAALDYETRARSLQRVVFCIFGRPAYDTFDRVLRDLQA